MILRGDLSVMMAVEAQKVTKAFGSGKEAVYALDEVSLSIGKNEFFTLLGPSGCGKTTLLRLIAGFESPSAGHILLEGEIVDNLPPHKRPVNTVFQSYALFPHMSVAENIVFGLQMLGWPREKIADRALAMLRLVKMETLKDRRITQISGGQQQRVALARALAPQPKVLLLDEPLSALDLKLRKEMQIELKRLQHETGITFIFVTHDQEEALTMSDRIAVMAAGQVRQIGSPRQIYDRPADRFVAHFIGDTNFLEGRIEKISGAIAYVRLAAGKSMEAPLPEGAVSAGKVTIAIRPEHARLVDPRSRDHDSDALLQGKIENIVYFGTDTHYHVRLDDESAFVVRHQNRHGEGTAPSLGDSCAIAIEPGASQILRD